MRDILRMHVCHALQYLLHDLLNLGHLHPILTFLVLLDNFFEVLLAVLENQILRRLFVVTS